jgi:hypothetical protein
VRLDLTGLMVGLADAIGQGLGTASETAAAGSVQVTRVELGMPSSVEPPAAASPADGPRVLGPVLSTLPSTYPAAPRPAGNFRLRLQTVERP